MAGSAGRPSLVTSERGEHPWPGRLTSPGRSRREARRTWRTPAGPVGKIPDEDQPYPLVDVVKAAMAPGSVVVISHATTDDLSPDAVKQVQELYAQGTAPAVPRSREEIARFFDSLELVPPGIVDAACWRAGPLPARPGRVLLLGGMARKR